MSHRACDRRDGTHMKIWIGDGNTETEKDPVPLHKDDTGLAFFFQVFQEAAIDAQLHGAYTYIHFRRGHRLTVTYPQSMLGTLMSWIGDIHLCTVQVIVLPSAQRLTIFKSRTHPTKSIATG